MNPKHKRWSTSEIARLKRLIGKLSHRQIAERLGRTTEAVHARADTLGLAVRKFWTAAERQFVIDNANKLSTVEIAKVLGRSESAVYQVRNQANLTKKRVPTGARFEAFLREKHILGWSDSEIAREWGCNRRTAEHWRRRLGLPHNAYSAHRRQRVREKTLEQCAKAGVPTLGHLRKKVFADRARAAGWPDDLRPRAVQIMNVLWEKGPMTRKQIAQAVGLTWRTSRSSLKSNDMEGSYLAHLIRRGLVLDLGRIGKVIGQGKGKSVHVYSLPLSIERKVAS